VPHRHYTFGIPKMLRPYFCYNRDLFKELCRITCDGLVDYQRTVLQLPDGISGGVMAVRTFGEYTTGRGRKVCASISPEHRRTGRGLSSCF